MFRLLLVITMVFGTGFHALASDRVVHVDYYENGNIKVEVTKLKRGLHEIRHYYPDGSLFETGFSMNGMTQGKWIRYNQEGDVIATAYFHNNIKIGSWDHYDRHTQHLYKVSYVDGEPVRYRQYDSAGKLVASHDRP